MLRGAGCRRAANRGPDTMPSLLTAFLAWPRVANRPQELRQPKSNTSLAGTTRVRTSVSRPSVFLLGPLHNYEHHVGPVRRLELSRPSPFVAEAQGESVALYLVNARHRSLLRGRRRGDVNLARRLLRVDLVVGRVRLVLARSNHHFAVIGERKCRAGSAALSSGRLPKIWSTRYGSPALTSVQGGTHGQAKDRRANSTRLAGS